MRSTISRTVALVLLATATLAAEPVTIEVIPTLAPNAYGSPSFSTWTSNAVTALQAGVSSYGDPSSPTYYQAISSAPTSWAVVTGFSSWNGQANPGLAFGPEYLAELGRRITFGLRITSDGQHSFSISQLSFSAASDDPLNALGFGWGLGSYAYGSNYVGLNYGTDRIRGTFDDYWITSGASTQLVDALFGRGSGNSFAAYCAPPSCTDAQAALDEAALYGPYSFTGTYSLEGGPSGSGTFNATTPEPGSVALIAVGLGLFIAKRRR